MDLYEALKKGTTDEDLRAKFEEELAVAQKKLESETAKNKRLQQTRNVLAAALKQYLDAFYGEDNSPSVEDIMKSLKSFEKYDAFSFKVNGKPVFKTKGSLFGDEWLFDLFK